ncbi:uncharacterized protein LOC132730111 [Ruditapes philippinarum]|uniref:uncharacterized protein LOC132730111 n=1 Tax=Ruditapes philippinarum TaxID=129788 RepID=UPI00295B0E85|nr:uncharacterized protein LOC132730111 [Ruditapes philippinarum]
MADDQEVGNNQSNIPNIFEKFGTLAGSSSQLEDIQNAIKGLTDSLTEMRSDVNSLKRTAVTCEETSTSKRFCTRDDSGSDHESVGDFFTESGVTDGNDDDDDDDEFCMVDFFEDASETGAAISDKLATLSNKALQVQPKEEKIKELLDTHKRPNNVEFLQVPLVNEQLWRQLPSQVKAQDFLLQRTQKFFSSALVPVLKTMDELKTDGRPKMKELIGDTFKLLTNAFVTTSQMRRDRIKKELLPLYRPICSANQSATHLFGDKVDEELKKLRDNKQQLTCTSRRSFLGKRQGMATLVPQHKRKHALNSQGNMNFNLQRRRQNHNYRTKQQKKNTFQSRAQKN